MILLSGCILKQVQKAAIMGAISDSDLVYGVVKSEFECVQVNMLVSIVTSCL